MVLAPPAPGSNGSSESPLWLRVSSTRSGRWTLWKPRARDRSHPSCGCFWPSGRGLRDRQRRRDDAAHDAVGAQMAHQGAGVDLSEDGNGVALHVLVGDLLGAPIGADRRELADDQAFDVGPGRLVVCLVGAVVSDLGIGENDDLAGIGGIGCDFLVAGKGSIENNLALAFARCP